MNYLMLIIFMLIICLLALVGISTWLRTATNFDPQAAPPLPDYTDLKYWAAHPNKPNPSDRLPPNCANETRTDAADIFYIYPTLHGTPFPMNSDRWNANLASTYLNKWIDRICIGGQATAFNAAGRIFAPRYREVHAFVYMGINKRAKQAAFDLAYEDVKTAFQYYLTHHNVGRPIIIAAHSQGATHGLRLLKDFFDTAANEDTKPLYKQLVVAYLIGIPVPIGALHSIKPSQSPTDTGCFCTWRTFRKGFKPEKSFIKHPDVFWDTNSHVTNPLTWQSDTEDYAPASANMGGFIRHKHYPNCADAQIYNSFLWADTPNVSIPFWISKGHANLHVMDYQFYYYNMRHNAVQRVDSFLRGK